MPKGGGGSPPGTGSAGGGTGGIDGIGGGFPESIAIASSPWSSVH